MHEIRKEAFYQGGEIDVFFFFLFFFCLPPPPSQWLGRLVVYAVVGYLQLAVGYQ